MEAQRDDGIERYRKYSQRNILFLIGLSLVLLALTVISLCLGPANLSPGDIFHILINKGQTWNDYVVWDIRLPRIMAAILAGFSLGIAGAVMQCILQNPLGSPFTLGISNAAAFGASIGIIVLSGGAILGQSVATPQIDNPYIVTLSAFAMAMVATGVIIMLVKITKATPETMVLAGMALSSIFAAGIAFLTYTANEAALSAIVFWQFGSLEKVFWDDLLIIAVVSALVIIYFLYMRWDYNALDAGDDVASGLGVNVNMTRIAGLTASAVITAVVVSFLGVIGFIGLIGPHIVRRVIGNDHRYLLPGSMLVGASVLVLADIIGQNLFAFVIPVGIITSFIGGPLFIYILIRGHRHA
ncbi:MAG: FecCD family ABC transporter permease [Candidatus Methanomethylophilaceae archaeon]